MLWRQPWSVTLEWRLLQVSPFWNNCLFSEEKINFQSAYFFKCSQAPCGLSQGLGEWSRQRGPVLVFLSSLYEAFCSPVCPVDWGKIPTIITNLRKWVSSFRSKKLSLGNGQFARALVCYEHSCAFLLQIWWNVFLLVMDQSYFNHWLGISSLLWWVNFSILDEAVHTS